MYPVDNHQPSPSRHTVTRLTISIKDVQDGILFKPETYNNGKYMLGCIDV